MWRSRVQVHMYRFQILCFSEEYILLSNDAEFKNIRKRRFSFSLGECEKYSQKVSNLSFGVYMYVFGAQFCQVAAYVRVSVSIFFSTKSIFDLIFTFSIHVFSLWILFIFFFLLIFMNITSIDICVCILMLYSEEQRKKSKSFLLKKRISCIFFKFINFSQ